jgi:hypothetical protein
MPEPKQSRAGSEPPELIANQKPLPRNGNGKFDWAFDPLNDPQKRPIPPLVVGNLSSAKKAHIIESPWDGVSVFDRLDLASEIEHQSRFGHRLGAAVW